MVADIIVIAIIVLCLAGVIYYQVSKKKKGDSGCCGCSGCSAAGSGCCSEKDQKISK